MLISIVGKSASGKSSICRRLVDIDDRFVHIDVDKISHYVLTIPSVMEELSKTFSANVISNGKINRKALGNIVFSSNEMMDELTRITWPYMEAIIDKLLRDNKSKIILLDWLLIPKTKFFEQSDLRIWVDAPFEERVDRALSREKCENITREYFEKRDNSGIEFNEDIYDIFVDNKNKSDIKEEVKVIYEKCFISR